MKIGRNFCLFRLLIDFVYDKPCVLNGKMQQHNSIPGRQTHGKTGKRTNKWKERDRLKERKGEGTGPQEKTSDFQQ